MNKNALITGGARRIGKEIAIHLAESGYNIALHFNSSYDDAINIQKVIENKGKICKIYKANFCNENEVIKLFYTVKEDFNKIDLLINNVSIFERFTLSQSTLEFINNTINVNLKSPLLLIKEFGSYFSGNIINILDSRIFKNDNKYFMYDLTKKALADITKMAAVEFAPRVRVNGISPGLILESEDVSKRDFENFVDKIPLKKIGSLEDILKTIDFILNSEYITGDIITLDGGWNLC